MNRLPEAASLLRFNPVPSASGTGPFLAFYFPRIFYLRARLAEREGKPAEAATNYRLFRALSGSAPLVWGEEQQGK